MSILCRRDVLKTGAALGLALGSGAAGLARAAAAKGPAFFVFDGRFGDGAVAAAKWRATGVAAIDVAKTELWHAWHARLAAALGEGARIEGLTPWSTTYICEQLGREQGLRWEVRGPAKGELMAWALVPNPI